MFSFASILTTLLPFVSLSASYTLKTGPPVVAPASAIQRAENIDTGNPSKCPAGTKFLPLPIDYATFNNNWTDPKQTSHMQYEVNDTFYQQGGPILYYQGAENAAITCVEFMNLMNWAKEINALVVTNEHRYFGISTPYGLNYSEFATWDTALMKPLTPDNVLRDSVSLITYIKTKAYPSAKDSKVILLGGSYAGTLALLYRTHYSDYIYATIALSPVSKGLVSDPNDPMIYGFGDWTNMVINDYSAEAANIIRQGMVQVREHFAAKNYSGLQTGLRLCEPPKTPDDETNLLQAVLGGYVNNLQYNFAVFQYPLQRTVNATLAAPDPFAAVGAAMGVYTNISYTTCVDWSSIKRLQGPFNYIRCTYLPYPGAYSRPESLWGHVTSKAWNESSAARDWECRQAFNVSSVTGGVAFQKSLKLDQDTLVDTSGLLVTEGLIDPTTALGPASWLPGRGRNHSRIMWVGQSGHGEVTRMPAATDSTALTESRLYILNGMKEWIGVTK
ncbi:hypothetical protein LTS17_001252 [Exophiala oligosperma]